MADRTEELGIRLSAEGVAEFVDSTGKVVGSVSLLGKETDKAAGSQQRMTQAQREGRAAANLLAQANRQLPMQVTDIATSLASGMPAWMVAIQQGGQLRDSYGGILPAGRALLGLLTPVNLAIGAGAAAVAGLGVAYFQARDEVTQATRAILISGNAAGVTGEQMSAIARGIAANIGTQGQAAEVVAALVNGARVAAPQIGLVGEAVQQMTRNLGFGTEQAVEMFNRLGREPSKAIADLNDRYNILTLEVYRQIRALEQQGRTAEAAALAQETTAKAMLDRGKQAEAQVWGIDAAWRAVKDTLVGVGDAMVQAFRPETMQDQIAQAQAALGRASRARGVPVLEWLLGTEEEAQQRLNDLSRAAMRSMDIGAANAQQQADKAREAREAIEAERERERTNRKPRTANAIESAEEEMWRRIQQWQERNQEALDKLDEQEAKATASDRDRVAQLELMQRNRMAVEQQVQALNEETAAMGLSAAALNELEQARIRDSIAREEANAAILQAQGLVLEADQARETARALRALALARQGNFERRQVVEEEADAKRRKELFADSIAQGIMEGYREGRSLTDIFLRELKAQFAKTVLTPRLQVLADAGNSLFEQIIGAAVGIFTGGTTGGDSIIPGGSPLPDVLRGGADTGTNYLKRDMVTLVHKGEAIVPEKFNPYAPGGGGGGLGRSLQLTFAPVINIDSRTDRAEVAGLVGQAMELAQANLLEKMERAMA